jgi:hypothetical protein
MGDCTVEAERMNTGWVFGERAVAKVSCGLLKLAKGCGLVVRR